MLGLTFIDFYVFWAVVCFITVDVVDYLSRLEGSAEDPLRDYSVFMPSVEFAVGLATTFTDSCCSVGFSVTVLGLPSSGVTLCV